MRPIKFRGRRSDGTFVYGLYVNIHGDDFIRDENNRGWPVTSVAQFVGYSKDGNEVYDGDTLINENGDEFRATLVPAVITDEGFQHDDIPIEIFTLKD